ncbi:protein-disulfide reductase DsbD domain-containing protein [Pelagibacterium sp.]|uniref:protein-disulfide reductase DsbD domain-containing protein n=1 Tax=Pelagibacterium sp. TaxID=1967288 RepID=UPI003A94E6D7
MKFAIATIMTFALVATGAAEETAWVEVAPDVSVRLVSSGVPDADGIVWMGLDIDMPADTKTYWRVPGETGLPLIFDIARSSGIDSVQIAWPYPTREITDGYLDHAFYGHVLLPLAVTVSDNSPSLVAEITMGICSDICVPANVSLELAPALDMPDSSNQHRIGQALANVPLPHDGADILGDASFDMSTEAITVALLDPGFDHASMIADIANTTLVFGKPELIAPGQLSFALLGRSGPETLRGAVAHFTFENESGPFEITRLLD